MPWNGVSGINTSLAPGPWKKMAALKPTQLGRRNIFDFAVSARQDPRDHSPDGNHRGGTGGWVFKRYGSAMFLTDPLDPAAWVGTIRYDFWRFGGVGCWGLNCRWREPTAILADPGRTGSKSPWCIPGARLPARGLAAGNGMRKLVRMLREKNP